MDSPSIKTHSHSSLTLLVDWLGIVVIPILLFSIYLGFSRSFLGVTNWYDLPAIVISILPGVFCLWRVCRNSTAFALFAPTYAIATGLGLFVYGLWFVGTFYGQWI